MLLAFDTGNTHTVIGVYDGPELVGHWRLASDRRKTVDEYGLMLRQLFQQHGLDSSQVDKVILSSVVPNVTGVLKEMVQAYFGVKPMVVGSGIKTGLVIRYENPREVGADRIVNAVAALDKYGPPLVLVDFGTATTFCAVNGQKEYLGGAIVPGIGISMDALFTNTAQLPKVELLRPKNVIGRNTVNAIQSGLMYGYCDLVDGMVRRFADEMGYGLSGVHVVATGGLAEVVCQGSKTVQHIEPLLTLEGLRLLADKNS